MHHICSSELVAIRESSRFELGLTMESVREPSVSVFTACVEYASDNEVDAPHDRPLVGGASLRV